MTGVQTCALPIFTCKACGGHRYNRETLEVKYKGKNIDDVLNMTVNMAVEFFANIPSIHQKLKAIQDVGPVSYTHLGGRSFAYVGSCLYCPDGTCTRPEGNPCRHPELVRPSLEACGLSLIHI